MRLIDADFLVDALYRSSIWGWSTEEDQTAHNWAIYIVNEMPTIELKRGEQIYDPKKLYIKIYAEDEPSTKIEKLYQICDESEQKELAEWFKEYFPSAQPKRGEWIPCEEQLPENGKAYLVLQECDGHFWNQVLEYNDGWNCTKDSKEFEIDYVVAWMPLPELYKD